MESIMSLFNKTARRLRTRDGKRTISLGVELVENRMLLANVIPVKTTVDNGNNTTPTADSLRAAIVAANETPDSTIVFQITSGASPFVINVTSTALLPITAETTIDATTNLGLPAVIQINGGGQAFDGLSLGAKSDHSTITGLNIADFGGAGIRVESANDTITDNLIGTDSTGLAAGPGNQVGECRHHRRNGVGHRQHHRLQHRCGRIDLRHDGHRQRGRRQLHRH
jgi:hypothetical protein